MVLFDLPTLTKLQRDNANEFRKELKEDGFEMFQLSVYIRHCMSRENMLVHRERVLENLPPKGKICMFSITDKQFGQIEIFRGKTRAKKKKDPEQLEMF